ncbi:MAG: hypothetical protein EOM19_05295 [Candidatus Moranbacteria bacterium]|nr:hypothetical protein [Candidatus Moranbacteria bacterium]
MGTVEEIRQLKNLIDEFEVLRETYKKDLLNAENNADVYRIKMDTCEDTIYKFQQELEKKEEIERQEKKENNENTATH